MNNVRLGYLLTITVMTFIAIIYQIQIVRLQDKIFHLENNANQNERKQNSREVLGNDDLVVVYNRVPKTGSTSFIGVAYDLCKKNKFHVLHVNITANNHVLSLNNQHDFVHNVTNWNVMKPGIYHGHFAFIDFTKFGGPKPLFINILRKPLERFISYYYFVRYGDNYRPYLVRRKHGNTMSFDECVEKNLPDCDPTHMWLQIPFLCGHAANCWKPGNKWALSEAKKNLVNNYLLVGVTDEINDFVAILEQTLPRIFKGAFNHYLTSNKSHLRQTVQKDAPSPNTIKKIQESTVWQMENELYEFALDQFHFIKKHTLKDKLQNVMYEKIRPKIN
ncbi:heparin sulfate O-sulfotransferase-like [Tribolium madens]|uniref:heparin sulfate O-sulfotransferase-like n=1 Tax=Tribolium madens TaxID=41895 RepID=UPI001CF7490F|nr:heparin sulfate O-sulfotransferase-like [Tribolium madens]